MPSSGELLTPRLAVRPPSEADRDRFVELFGDEAFMVFSSGPLTNEASHRRFEHMLAVAEVVFAKQPVVERGSGLVIGYTGVDYFEFENETRLGWGYRIAPEFRGRGTRQRRGARCWSWRVGPSPASVGDHRSAQPPTAERLPQGRLHLLEGGVRRWRAPEPLHATPFDA